MNRRTLSRIGSWLADFRRRFSPAVAIRLATKGIDDIPKTIEISSQKLDEEYRSIISGLDKEFPDISFRKAIPQEKITRADNALESLTGFRLQIRGSSISGAGRGVFVSSGTIPAGRIASIYPGTIYDREDPIFFQSIGNHFVLKCQDGIIIDGNDRRLSARIHRSCVRRDLSMDISDLTWLTGRPFNFLNAGQYVNNGGALHNVQYIDLDIVGWPRKFRKFLPYAVYLNSPNRSTPFRVVLLVAVRHIEAGEELLSAYISK